MTKLTISQELRAIDMRDLMWYKSLTTEEHDKFIKTMWVFQRWISSVQSNVTELEHHYLTMVNECVNVRFSDLKNHPELQYRLLMVIGVGSAQSHKWIPALRKLKVDVGVNPKLFELYLKDNQNLNDQEVNLALSLASKDDIIELLTAHGIPANQIKSYLK